MLLDGSEPGPLVSEATALPIVPQPLWDQYYKTNFAVTQLKAKF